MRWVYKSKEINTLEDVPENAIGFVYEITHVSGKKYIGKKSLYHATKTKLSKKKLLEQKGKIGRPITHIRSTKESDWKKYFGSNIGIKNIIKETGTSNFTREILEFAFNKTHLTYLELKYLVIFDILKNQDKYFNDNILGKFYSKNVFPNNEIHP